MEHKNGGLEDDFPFLVPCKFSRLPFAHFFGESVTCDLNLNLLELSALMPSNRFVRKSLQVPQPGTREEFEELDFGAQ